MPKSSNFVTVRIPIWPPKLQKNDVSNDSAQSKLVLVRESQLCGAWRQVEESRLDPGFRWTLRRCSDQITCYVSPGHSFLLSETQSSQSVSVIVTLAQENDHVDVHLPWHGGLSSYFALEFLWCKFQTKSVQKIGIGPWKCSHANCDALLAHPCKRAFGNTQRSSNPRRLV